MRAALEYGPLFQSIKRFARTHEIMFDYYLASFVMQGRK